MRDLAGKVAVLTGGGSAIGAALARARPRAWAWQPPEGIGSAVLEGVRANDAFIVTHAQYREAVEARHAERMRAFDKADARSR